MRGIIPSIWLFKATKFPSCDSHILPEDMEVWVLEKHHFLNEWGLYEAYKTDDSDSV